jgi:outer membrane protein assembly factor BamA
MSPRCRSGWRCVAVLVCAWVLLQAPAHAQALEVEYIRPVPPAFRRDAEAWLEPFRASLAAGLLPDTALAPFRAAGRLECRADTLLLSEGRIRLRLDPGPLYLLESLELAGLDAPHLQRHRLEPPRRPVPLDWQGLETRLRSCLDGFQQEGYPFAAFGSLGLRYRRGGGDTVFCAVSYRFDPGARVQIDSVRIGGAIRERPAFVHAYARLAPGDLYSQQAIEDAARLLGNSMYYEMTGPPQVQFRPGAGAVVTLPLKPRRAGRLDVLLGILPASGPDRSLQVTGLADILLVSPFRAGEVIRLKYRKLTQTSQQMQAGFSWPCLFGLPLGVEGELELLKQLEQFLNVDYAGAATLSVSSGLSVRLFARQRATRLLSAALRDTLGAGQLDSRRRTFGAGLAYEQLDYRISPSRGISFRLDAGIGTRTILRNVLLPAALYDTLDLVQGLREIRAEAAWYHPLAGRHILHLAGQAAWLGLGRYLRNDQWQLGGARSIRGFDENRFFADAYATATLEYRFRLERDSYLFAFTDAGGLRDRVEGASRWLWGWGLGMQYATRAGLVNLTYAAGSTAGEPFQPARGKIHVGFINQF